MAREQVESGRYGQSMEPDGFRRGAPALPARGGGDGSAWLRFAGYAAALSVVAILAWWITAGIVLGTPDVASSGGAVLRPGGLLEAVPAVVRGSMIVAILAQIPVFIGLFIAAWGKRKVLAGIGGALGILALGGSILAGFFRLAVANDIAGRYTHVWNTGAAGETAEAAIAALRNLVTWSSGAPYASTFGLDELVSLLFGAASVVLGIALLRTKANERVLGAGLLAAGIFGAGGTLLGSVGSVVAVPSLTVANIAAALTYALVAWLFWISPRMLGRD
ncbi:MAG: hypothetical protein HYY08_02655 [Firmicutes bacterium]|nr:hypothetical protein [Bacillota bacterium]